MDPATLPKASLPGRAVATLALVFLCGAATGAVLMRIREHQVHLRPAGTPGLSASVEDWKRQLNLTEDQASQLVSVLDDVSKYYGTVMADGNSKIMQVLNPEQKKRFEELLRERRR